MPPWSQWSPLSPWRAPRPERAARCSSPVLLGPAVGRRHLELVGRRTILLPHRVQDPHRLLAGQPACVLLRRLLVLRLRRRLLLLLILARRVVVLVLLLLILILILVLWLRLLLLLLLLLLLHVEQGQLQVPLRVPLGRFDAEGFLIVADRLRPVLPREVRVARVEAGPLGQVTLARRECLTVAIVGLLVLPLAVQDVPDVVLNGGRAGRGGLGALVRLEGLRQPALAVQAIPLLHERGHRLGARHRTGARQHRDRRGEP